MIYCLDDVVLITPLTKCARNKKIISKIIKWLCDSQPADCYYSVENKNYVVYNLKHYWYDERKNSF